MFIKDSRFGTKGKDRVPSIISASLRITGDLVSEGDVQVDGVIEGDINARSLTVSEGATVKGEITAEMVTVRGTLEGKVTAESVALGRTAEVRGDIHHHELAVEPGAILDGRCYRRQGQPKSAAVSGESKANGAKAGEAKPGGPTVTAVHPKPSAQAAE